MKKIICIVLCFVILALTPAYAVENLNSDEVFAEQEPAPELYTLTMYCNGVESNIVTIPYKWSANAPVSFYSQSYQYITIANTLGYTTTYNEETEEIVSVKDGRTIKLKVGDYDAFVTEGETTNDVFLYDVPFVVEGRTFISRSALKNLFDVELYLSDYDEENPESLPYINIYEYNHFYRIFKENFTEYENLIEKIAEICNPDIDFQTEAQMEYKLDFNSPAFGTTIKGSGKTKFVFEDSDSYKYMKVSNNSDGIFNLLDFSLYAFDYDFYNEENSEKRPEIDLDKTDELEMYYTPENIYLKSDDVVYYNMYGTDYFNGENIKDKWLKLPNLAFGEEIASFDDENFEMAKDYLIREVIASFLERNSHLSYNEICCKITEFTNTFNKDIIKYNEKTKTLKIDCSAKDFKNIVMFLGFTEKEAQWAAFDFESTDVYDDKGLPKGQGKLSYTLTNIPNPFNVEIGTVSFEMKITSKSKQLNQKRAIPSPESIINIDETDNGAI